MKGEKLVFQIKFWAVLGPLIGLLAFLAFFVKIAASFLFLPFLLLIGVPLCWRWRFLGLGITTAMIAGYLGYYYTEIPLEDRFWYLGMGMAISLVLFITILSFDEVAALIAGVQLESRSRLENLWKVDEKQRQTEENLKTRKEQIREFQIKVRSYKKLIDMSTSELVDLRDNYNKAAQELEQLQEEKTQWKKRGGNHDGGEEYLPLLGGGTQAFAEMQRALQQAQAEAAQVRRELEEVQLAHGEELERVLREHLDSFEKEKTETEAEHQQELDVLEQMYMT